jgi:hypothetical protein
MSWSPINAEWFAPAGAPPPIVEDSGLLCEAEAAVRAIDPLSANARALSEFAAALEPMRVGGYLINPGANAFVITSGPDAANIAHAWDPYPPELMPMYRPGSGAVDRPFALYVAPADLEDASEILTSLGVAASVWSGFSAPVTPRRSPDAEYYRLVRFFWFIVIGYGFQIFTGTFSLVPMRLLR